MKCLILFITLCAVGRFINGENVSSLEITSDENPSEESSSEAEEDEMLKAEDEESKKQFQDTMKLYINEMAAGDMADLIGQNPHIQQSHLYNDLGRRFVPQYKYTESSVPGVAEIDDGLVPEKAPPELVLLVAKESAKMSLGKDDDLGTNADIKKILRSGDYWNGVWKEEGDMKNIARSGTQKKVLGSIKAKIRPGSEFYKVVAGMKKLSPRLLYIINKETKSSSL